MIRYTLHFRFGEEYIPMINCGDLHAIGRHITSEEDGLGFRVYDNLKKDWVDPETVFLACIFSGILPTENNLFT